MKNKIITIITIIMMVGLVSSLSIGDYIFQERLDYLPLTLKAMKPTLDINSNGRLLVNNCDAEGCYAYMNIGRTLEKVKIKSVTIYRVFERKVPIYVSKKKYIDLASETNKSYAWDVLYNDVKQQGIKKLRSEKNTIESWKTPQEQFEDIINEGTITGTEIQNEV